MVFIIDVFFVGTVHMDCWSGLARACV